MTDLRAASRHLVPLLRERAAEAEAGARVPRDLSDQLGEAGLYRMLVPSALGGAEAHPRLFAEVLETLATGDGAAAWVVMTGSTTGVLTAYLDEDAARELLDAEPAAALAGVFAPTAMAVPEDGGYRVSGRWAYGSGAQNAAWIMGGAVVPTAEGPRRLADGSVEIRSCFFRAADVTIHDTWKVSGLRGTGSHDLEVAEVFVPTARTACLAQDAPRHDAPLYRFPVFGLLATGVSAVGLGLAARALELAHEHAIGKTKIGSSKTLADSELVQIELARARGDLGAARAYLHSTLEATWESTAGGAPITVPQRAELRLAASHAARAAAAVVDSCYSLCGGRAIWDRNPLSRIFRDVHVMTQHIMVGNQVDRAVGRIGLGLKTNTAQL